jgi:hypothetical protein
MKENINSFEVMDRKSFVELLDLLKKDFVKNDENWENQSKMKLRALFLKSFQELPIKTLSLSF